MIARRAFAALAVVLICSIASAEPVSVDRIDVRTGDTMYIDGFKTWLEGCDTPETTEAKCDIERERGELAAARLRRLIRSGPVDVRWTRRLERYKRGLIRLYVDKRNVCTTLIEEGLAIRSRGGQRIDWCKELPAAH